MGKFKNYLQKIRETSVEGAFGVSNTVDSMIETGDTYATGDARIPQYIGTSTRWQPNKKKNKNGKRKQKQRKSVRKSRSKKTK